MHAFFSVTGGARGLQVTIPAFLKSTVFGLIWLVRLLVAVMVRPWQSITDFRVQLTELVLSEMARGLCDGGLAGIAIVGSTFCSFHGVLRSSNGPLPPPLTSSARQCVFFYTIAIHVQCPSNSPQFVVLEDYGEGTSWKPCPLLFGVKTEQNYIHTAAVQELHNDFGLTASFYRIDVRDSSAVEECINGVVRDYGKIDVHLFAIFAYQAELEDMFRFLLLQLVSETVSPYSVNQ